MMTKYLEHIMKSNWACQVFCLQSLCKKRENPDMTTAFIISVRVLSKREFMRSLRKSERSKLIGYHGGHTMLQQGTDTTGASDFIDLKQQQ